MNVTLADLTGVSCMVYLDDIIIFNYSGESDHIKRLEEVFESKYKTKTKEM